MTRLAFIITLLAISASNVFSPQYLLWAAPFVMFLTKVEISLFLVATTLTSVYFRFWPDVIALEPLATQMLIARNLTILGLVVVSCGLALRQLTTQRNRDNMKTS